MKLRRVLMSAGASAMLAAGVSNTLAQTNTFEQTFSTAWHTGGNWSRGTVPTIGEDVVIPINKTCIISTDDAEARTVTVTGTLAVTNGFILQIRTPNSGSAISLTVNSQNLFVYDDGIIRLEDDGGDDVARIAGSGWLQGSGDFFTPGVIETSSDSYAVDWVHVDEDTTVFGDWYITASIDNDGTFLTGGDHHYMTFDHPSGVNTITGSGLFATTAGDDVMTFGCIDFDSGTLDATFASMGGDMNFVGCGAEVAATLDEAALVVDGGDMTFNGGFTMGGGDVAVSDGTLLSYQNVVLAATPVTVDGVGTFRFDEAEFYLNSGSSLVVEEDGELDGDDIYTGVIGDSITITIDDTGEFSCDYFEFDETDFTLLSGTFDVAGFGSNNTPSLASSTTAITISGGTFSIAWGYDGDGSELTLSGGTIEVLASADSNDTFFNDGDSLYLTGTIEVKEGEKLILD